LIEKLGRVLAVLACTIDFVGEVALEKITSSDVFDGAGTVIRIGSRCGVV
jgi:hypothetical protein